MTMEVEEKEALSIVEPIASMQKLLEAMNKFEELKRGMLVEDDWQTIGEKRYIRRSGLRKIALAFGLSDEIIEQVRTDRPDGSFMWRIRVRAMAKNGRSSEGVGACDSRERNFAHFEHDVYATAHTRAKSRAISDLVAGGAVSAEEIESQESQAQDARDRAPVYEGIKREAAYVATKRSETERDVERAQKPITKEQTNEIIALCRVAGRDVEAALMEKYGIKVWFKLSSREANEVLGYLQAKGTP